jgi:hypothetical protein
MMAEHGHARGKPMTVRRAFLIVAAAVCAAVGAGNRQGE